jgi:hypothetical protein
MDVAIAPVLPPNLDPHVRARVADLVERQLGVALRQQLIAVGVTDAQIDRCLAVARWREIGAGIVVTHNGPLTGSQEWTVAVLAGGRVCALAARSAAQAAGLLGWEPSRPEVVVPRGTTYPSLRGFAVRVHESRRFALTDVVPTSWPPRVTIERALVDGAAWSGRPRTACGLLAAGVQQRLTTGGRLLAELAEAGRIRHRRILHAALIDIEGGAQAVSEIDFIRFCRRHGFPEPIRQVVRRDANGRRRYLDATLVGPTGKVVRVEIDGALHLVVRTYWDDMSRGNELSIARETALRMPSIVLHHNDPIAVDQIRRALNLSGPSAHLSAQAS